jgi:VanZ family protein
MNKPEVHFFDMFVLLLTGGTAAVILFVSLLRRDTRLFARVPLWLPTAWHLSSYMLFAFLCVLSLDSVFDTSLSLLFGGFTVATGFGALMEYLQRYRPGRTPSIADGLINACGAALGALAALTAI